MLGVSTGLLSFGAAAVGWTSPGTAIGAAVTGLAFAVFAAALLAAGVANSWAGRALRQRRPRRRPPAGPGGAQPVRPAIWHRAGDLRAVGPAAPRNTHIFRGVMSEPGRCGCEIHD